MSTEVCWHCPGLGSKLVPAAGVCVCCPGLWPWGSHPHAALSPALPQTIGLPSSSAPSTRAYGDLCAPYRECPGPRLWGIPERILLAALLPANHMRASEGLSGSPGRPGEAGLGPLSLRVLLSYWVLFLQPPHRNFGLEGAIGTSLSLLYFWLGLPPSAPSPLLLLPL